MARKDGIRIKDADPSYSIMCYLLKERNDAQNMITVNIPVDPMNRYIRERAKDGVQISHLALILAAYLRAAAEFKKLNWFVVNKKIYQHTDFKVAMVVQKPGEHEGSTSKMTFDFNNTIDEVQQIINDFVSFNRATTTSTDKFAFVLNRMTLLTSMLVGLIKWMDNHNILPKAIIDASPFHNSLFISNLGSIRTNHIYHHCYNFGTTSMFITMGNLVETLRHGKVVKCLPLGIVMDERIASGSYFAMVFQRIKTYLDNPHLLEVKPDFELLSK